jgi:hypothetical protein
MADKFFGKVGFGKTEETRPGVREDVITELEFFGDVLQPGRSVDDGENTTSRNNRVSNRISILATEYAFKNVPAIRFVEWEGVTWYISRIEKKEPRLILSLGEVYNGPRASTP